MVFNATYLSELRNAITSLLFFLYVDVTLYRTKSFMLYIVPITYLIFVGNKWKLHQEVIDLCD